MWSSGFSGSVVLQAVSDISQKRYASIFNTEDADGALLRHVDNHL
jgi:hypothetical protein